MIKQNWRGDYYDTEEIKPIKPWNFSWLKKIGIGVLIIGIIVSLPYLWHVMMFFGFCYIVWIIFKGWK